MHLTTSRDSDGLPANLNFRFSDFLLKRRDIEKMIENIPSPILAAGSGLPDPNVVHVFDSQESFDAWARKTKFAPQFEEINRIIAVSRQTVVSTLADPEPEEVTFGQPVLVSNAKIESGAISTEMNVTSNGASSTNAFQQLSVGSSKASNIAVIYEREHFHGDWHPLGPAAVSDLSTLDMYQRVSSLRVSGVCLLTDETWFRGARLYLVGDPLLQVSDLSEWGFKGRAASAIVV